MGEDLLASDRMPHMDRLLVIRGEAVSVRIVDDSFGHFLMTKVRVVDRVREFKSHAFVCARREYVLHAAHGKG